MRKVVATCIYSKEGTNGFGRRGFACWNFTVNHKGNNVTLVQYTPDIGPQPYMYLSFNDLYASLLNILKNNGYCTQVYTEFGRDFYNIQFIKLGTTVISKYGYVDELKDQILQAETYTEEHF